LIKYGPNKPVHIRTQFKDSEPQILFMSDVFTYRADNFELGFIVGKEEALTFTFTIYKLRGDVSTHDEKIDGWLEED